MRGKYNIDTILKNNPMFNSLSIKGYIHNYYTTSEFTDHMRLKELRIKPNSGVNFLNDDLFNFIVQCKEL